MSRSSGWSGGPGYSLPKHRRIWYSGSWRPSCRWARSSTGTKTGRLGIPPSAHRVLYPAATSYKASSPLRAYAVCPLPPPYTCLMPRVCAHFQCSRPVRRAPVLTLTFMPTPYPLPFTYAYLVPSALMPSLCLAPCANTCAQVLWLCPKPALCLHSPLACVHICAQVPPAYNSFPVLMCHILLFQRPSQAPNP